MAALSWLKSNPGVTATLDTQERLAIIQGYAAGNPTEALAYVNGLPDTDPNKQGAVNALISGMAQNGDFPGMTAMIDSLPATMQNAAYAQFVSEWATAAPADAAKWISGLDPTTYRRQMGQYSQTLLGTWASTDPLAAAQWASQQDAANSANTTAGPGGRAGGGPGGGRGGNLLATTVQDWVAAGGVDEAGQYLNTLPASPTKDSATATYVRNVMTDDPGSAMAWAKTITSPNQQIASMDTVAQNWNAQDPAGFTAYLATVDPTTAQQPSANRRCGKLAASGRGGFGGTGGPGGQGGPGGFAGPGGSGGFGGRNGGNTNGNNGGGTVITGNTPIPGGRGASGRASGSRWPCGWRIRRRWWWWRLKPQSPQPLNFRAAHLKNGPPFLFTRPASSPSSNPPN